MTLLDFLDNKPLYFSEIDYFVVVRTNMVFTGAFTPIANTFSYSSYFGFGFFIRTTGTIKNHPAHNILRVDRLCIKPHCFNKLEYGTYPINPCSNLRTIIGFTF